LQVSSVPKSDNIGWQAFHGACLTLQTTTHCRASALG
jgi:hypothetical protein